MLSRTWRSAARRADALSMQLAPTLAYNLYTTSETRRREIPQPDGPGATRCYDGDQIFANLFGTKWCERGQKRSHGGKRRYSSSQRRGFSTTTSKYNNDAQARSKPEVNGQEGALDKFYDEESLKGRGLHRAWQIQEYLTKRMAIELLLIYAIKHMPVGKGDIKMEDLVADMRAIDETLTNMRWKRRLDYFGIDLELEELADSEQAWAARRELDMKLITLSKAFERTRDVGTYIESAVEAIMSATQPPSQRSLAVMLRTFQLTHYFEYGEIIHGAIRKSRLPWTNFTIYAILGHYRSVGNAVGFAHFVSFLCGPGARDNGLKSWRWTKIRGQMTVPVPPHSLGMLQELIQTALSTGQMGYAKSYLQILLDGGYGVTAKLFWSLMMHYSEQRDWGSARIFLQQICEGSIPLTPDAVTPTALQRMLMACMQHLLATSQSELCWSLVQIAVKYNIPPFEPGPHTKVSFNWAKIISQWEQKYSSSSSSSSSSTTATTPSPKPETVNAKALFKELAKLLNFGDECPGFILTEAADTRTVSLSDWDKDGQEEESSFEDDGGPDYNPRGLPNTMDNHATSSMEDTMTRPPNGSSSMNLSQTEPESRGRWPLERESMPRRDDDASSQSQPVEWSKGFVG